MPLVYSKMNSSVNKKNFRNRLGNRKTSTYLQWEAMHWEKTPATNVGA